MTTHKTLRDLAEAATNKDWSWVRASEYAGESWLELEIPRDNTDSIYKQTSQKANASDTDAAFIAAANPQAVLGLLDEVEELRSSLAWALKYGDFSVAEDNVLHASMLDKALSHKPAQSPEKEKNP